MNLKFNNNDNRKFLQFEIEDNYQKPILAMIYYPSIDSPLSLFQIIKANFLLGIFNFGTVKEKEKKIYRYFVEDNKFISDSTLNNIFQLCELIPGATLMQILISINLIKTKSFFYALIGILFFALPGLIVVASFSFAFQYYNQFFIVDYIKNALAHAGIALLLNFSFEQMKNVFQSNFQMGLIIINTVVLCITNNFLTLIILLLVSGFLCMKNKESEYLIEKASTDIIKIITHDSYCSFLGLPCVVLYMTIFILFVILAFYVFDYFLQFLYLYTIGSVIFIDYAGLNFLCVLFDFTYENILSSFGLMSIFQGHFFNIILTLFIDQKKNFFLSAMGVISCYLPSVLVLGFFIQIFPVLNDIPNVQFMLKGMKTASIGFIIALLPKLWYFSCVKNIFYHWIIATFIILIGSFCFFKQKMFLGFTIIIALSMIFSFICE